MASALALQCTVCSSDHLHFHVSFLLWVKTNSTNWPALNVWVIKAQLVQHCSTDPEAKGFYPIEALKFFFKLILQFIA